MTKVTKAKAKKEPNWKVKGIVTSNQTLANILADAKGRGKSVPIQGVSGAMYEFTDFTPKLTGDVINNPPHYKVGGIETLDFIEAKGLNYHLGNVVKYISRADHKTNRLEDLKKAQFYLNRAILEEEKTKGEVK